jgi:hypothetical protein
VPWSALGPDGDTLLFGFGSDASDGSSALDDLWRLSLARGEWEELTIGAVGDEGSPSARGFAPFLPGPAGSAGVLAGGYDGTELLWDGFVLLPPDDLAGRWR